MTTSTTEYQAINSTATAQFELARLKVESFYSGPLEESRVINIVFDGTNNNKDVLPVDKNGVPTARPTNPALLYDKLKAENEDTYYIRGIGSPVTSGDKGSTLDQGVAQLDAMRQLEEAWTRYISTAKQILSVDPNAKIQVNVIGFSRGAVVAREFMNRVDDWGVPSAQSTHSYIDHEGKTQVKVINDYGQPSIQGGQVRQTALLYDTVEGSGILNSASTTTSEYYDQATGYEFRLGIPASVDSLLHLVAANEERDLTFGVTSVKSATSPNDPRILELTLPGVHSDIGGSYLQGPGNYTLALGQTYLNNLGLLRDAPDYPEPPTVIADSRWNSTLIYNPIVRLFLLNRPVTFVENEPLTEAQLDRAEALHSDHSADWITEQLITAENRFDVFKFIYTEANASQQARQAVEDARESGLDIRLNIGSDEVDQLTAGLSESEEGASGSSKILMGYGGADLLAGNAGDNILLGGEGTDRINGGAGNELLDGGADFDTILGGAGSDVIIGSSGDDHLIGGKGEDSYVYRKGDGYDLINAHGESELDRDSLSLLELNSSEVKKVRNGFNLTLLMPDDGRIDIIDWFRGGAHQLKTISFEDRILSSDEINDQIEAGSDYAQDTARAMIEFIQEKNKTPLLDRDIVATLFAGTHDNIRILPIIERMELVTPDGELQDPNKLKQLLNDIFVIARNTRYDPLVLDLTGDGVQSVGLQKGVQFDLDANGFKETTGWVSPYDGLVVRDLNGNGTIDNGSELLGDRTVLPDGSTAAAGFEALAALDSNQDGVVDDQDAAWGNLRVWQDTNGDGISSAGELHTMTQLGIQAIATDHTAHTQPIEHGNLNATQQAGHFIWRDGRVGEAASLLFSRNTAASAPSQVGGESSDVAALPEIQGMGVMRSLRQASMLDPVLKQLANDFCNSAWSDAETAFNAVLLRWADADTVVSGTRGRYVDAQQLAVLEKFYGQSYINLDGGSNPIFAHEPVLTLAYQVLYEKLFAEAMLQTHLAPYFSKLTFSLSSDGEFGINYSDMSAQIRSAMATDTEYGIWLLTQSVRALRGINVDAEPGYAEFEASFADIAESLRGIPLFGRAVIPLVGDARDNTINLTNNGDLAFGGGGNDVLNGGSKSDYLSGGAGDDTLWGNGGNDVLDGGAGNDRLYSNYEASKLRGGDGNDILFGYYWATEGSTFEGGTGADSITGTHKGDLYIFNLGDGHDTIAERDEQSNVDVLKFGPGLLASDLTVRRVNANLVISHSNGTDSITFVDWYTQYGGNQIERFEFADGTTWTSAELSALGLTIQGTDAADTLSGLDFANDTMLGDAGNDKLSGQGGDDLLIGGTGDDELQGDDGNDVLRGGDGNDLLNGGAGDDQLFGEGGDDILIAGAGRDLLDGGDGNDTLRAGYYASTLKGGNGDDQLIGLESADEGSTFIGGQGNDTITGTRKGDLYLFNLGDGHDTITESVDRLSTDVLRFGEGINPSDLTVSRNSTSLVISHSNGTDSITVLKWFNTSNNYQIERFEFFDGSVWLAYDVTAMGLVVQGTGAAETLTAMDGFNNTLYGLSGDDILIGKSGNDILFGGDGKDDLRGGYGDDQLFGGEGNDRLHGEYGRDVLYGEAGDDTLYGSNYASILIGGSGNDTLIGDSSAYEGSTFEGGTGNDTITGTRQADLYVFNLGDGHDTIQENSNTSAIDVLRFGSGVYASDFRASRNADKLVLTHINGTDSITIQNWFGTSTGYRIERFEFSDGTVWSHDAITASLLVQGGTAAGETLTGTYNYNDLLFGAAGNDVLNGGNGNDLLAGELGDDAINGGAGIDLAVGGLGNDTYSAAEGILFNKGDGHDIISTQGSSAGFISIGQAALSEISIVRENSKTKLLIGASDSITLPNTFSQNTVLQLVSNTESGERLVSTFDLKAIAALLYSAPGSIAGSDLAAYQLGSYADSAFGGDLAVSYAETGSILPMIQANPLGANSALDKSNQLQLLGGLN